MCYVVKAMKFYLFYEKKIGYKRKSLQNYLSAISKTLLQWLQLGKNYNICYITIENFTLIELYIFLEMENGLIDHYTAFPLKSISQNIQFHKQTNKYVTLGIKTFSLRL